MDEKIYVIRTSASSGENKRIEGLLGWAKRFFGVVAFQFRANDFESISEGSTRDSILKWEPVEIWLCGSDSPKSFKKALTIIGNIQTASELVVVDYTHPASPASEAVEMAGLRVVKHSKFFR